MTPSKSQQKVGLGKGCGHFSMNRLKLSKSLAACGPSRRPLEFQDEGSCCPRVQYPQPGQKRGSLGRSRASAEASPRPAPLEADPPRRGRAARSPGRAFVPPAAAFVRRGFARPSRRPYLQGSPPPRSIPGPLSPAAEEFRKSNLFPDYRRGAPLCGEASLTVAIPAHSVKKAF